MGEKWKPKGANNGSDDQKSIMGKGGSTCGNAKWSSPSSSYYTYIMAWRPKLGPRDDDFLLATIGRVMKKLLTTFQANGNPYLIGDIVENHFKEKGLPPLEDEFLDYWSGMP